MTKARAIEWKMTKEEAIAMIEDDKKRHHDELSGRYRAALTMAIEALEQEQSEIIRCKNCRHDNNCEIQYSAQAGSEFFCGSAERRAEQ